MRLPWKLTRVLMGWLQTVLTCWHMLPPSLSVFPAPWPLLATGSTWTAATTHADLAVGLFVELDSVILEGFSCLNYSVILWNTSKSWGICVLEIRNARWRLSRANYWKLFQMLLSAEVLSPGCSGVQWLSTHALIWPGEAASISK